MAIQDQWKQGQELTGEEAFSLLCWIDLLTADAVMNTIQSTSASNKTNIALLAQTIELSLGEGSLVAIAGKLADGGALMPQTLTDEQIAKLHWIIPGTPPDDIRAHLMYLGRYGHDREASK